MSDDVLTLAVSLPLPLTHAWVAYACQKASLPRPRWNHELREWSSGSVIVHANENRHTLRVTGHERVVRALVSTLVTGMMQRTRSCNATGSLGR